MKNIENTLVAEVVQLFAKMALADGVVNSEEKEYIKKYFNSLYPEDFAKGLYSEFEKAVNTNINIDEILSSINRRLNGDDKIFLIIKLIELMVADEIDSSEKQLLYQIAKKFNITDNTTNFLIKIISKDNDIGNNICQFSYINISDRAAQGDVLLPFPNIKLTIINIGKSLIVFQNDTIYDLKIDNKYINKGFATRVLLNSKIIINDDYEIYYQDLKFYLRNKNSSKNIFYLFENNDDIEINNSIDAANLIKCIQNGCELSLIPIKESKLLINNELITDKTAINFDDEIFWDKYKINLRSLISQGLYQLEKRNEITDLSTHKLTIGNNIESNMFIEDDYDIIWDCTIEFENDNYYFDVNLCPYNVLINDRVVTKRTKINLTDKIRIKNTIISYNTTNQIFEQNIFGFNTFEAQNIYYQFNDKAIGINEVSFTAKRGELLAVMGTSGCGKSTLLNILNSSYSPQKGSVLADEYNIHNNIDLLIDHLGYVPQDDLLFENLTVYENLYYNAKLRHFGTTRNIDKIVNKILNDIGLYEKRNIRVGSPLNKTLSGGERKRVNIGLELLSESNVILLDEPTSGLSSKDSERILTLLQNLTFQGKIIFVVIHQPSVKLYELFNKVLLLDKGGKLAYFGSPSAALQYFSKYSKEFVSNNKTQVTRNPDFLLDTLEQQILDIDGTPLAIRKHTAEFWKNEFAAHIKKKINKNTSTKNKNEPIPKKQRKTIANHLSISLTLLQRNFVNKFRDKSNLIITFLMPPILGFFVGAILHYSPGDNYCFFVNKHIGTFLFLSMLISIFLGITNSVEEIIKDQSILQRERMLRISNISYFNSKMLTLIPFALIQNTLFVLVGYYLLEGQEFYFIYIVILTLVSICGISLGLLISSIPKLSSKAAVNIIPIVLIPQIVFGGALIQYQEMNKQLVIFENSPVPEICQVMPSRWGFEALVTYLGYNNSYKEIELLESKRDSVTDLIKNTEKGVQFNKLISERNVIRQEIDAFKLLYHDSHGNLDISQAIKIDGNQEYKNFKKGLTSVYPMFIGEKELPIIKKMVSTPLYNSIILIFMSLMINFLTIIVLKLRFK